MVVHRRKIPMQWLLLGGAAVVGVLLALLVLWGISAVNDLGTEVRAAEARADRLERQRNDQAAAVDALASQVEALGAKPVVTPDPRPLPVPRGITETQVRSIVADALADRRLELTPSQVDSIARVAASQVPRPRPGQPPSTAEVRAVVEEVVEAVCAGNACRGDVGQPGPEGQQGPQGPQGERGPGPTDAQVDERLVAYCSTRTDCRGPAGPAGEAGTDGQDGRGIRSGPDFVMSDGRCVARTTYTDGTTYESPAGSAACLLQ